MSDDVSMTSLVMHNREGPLVIPAHTRTVKVEEQRLCTGCRYFKSHTTMIGGYFGGYFAQRRGYDDCRHPEAMIYYDDHDNQMRLKTPDIGVPRVIRHWSLGLESNVTPDWCPYLKKKESSDASSIPSPAAR